MKFTALLLLLFPSLLVAPSLAATINVSPGQDIVGEIGSAHYGDTVVIGAGTFNVGSPITVPSGVTVTGLSPSSSHIVFNLSGGDQTSYGFTIAGNASNVSIEQLDLYSNHGLIQMSLGDPYTDSFNHIVITQNNLQYGPGQLSDGTLVFGIFGSMTNNGLQITHNYFHDSTAQSSRNWGIWAATNANLDYNVFYNIEDGGQLSDPGPNVSFSHNYGTHIHRMGQEAGLYSGSSLNINGNVFYDWVNPYEDSDALSIIGVSGQINYTNNYFKASIAPGSSWGPPDGGGLNRFGIAIEGSGQPADVTGNTFVGTWASLYSSTMPNAQIWNNTVYGGGIWDDFAGEAGPIGYGSVTAWDNNIDNNANDAPAPPANTFAGPNGNGASTAAAAPASTPTSATGGSLSGDQSAALSSNNLTVLGSGDWAHWGRGGVYGNFDHKASGNSQISNVGTVGSGGFGGYADPSRDVSWSAGTPTSSDGGDDGYIWANNGIGAGYSFTVPASTTAQTVYVYAGGYSSGSTLTAHLSDGSAGDYVVSSSGSSHYAELIAITYKSASAGQKLTLTYVKSQNINGSGGSADLIAAWLQ